MTIVNHIIVDGIYVHDLRKRCIYMLKKGLCEKLLSHIGESGQSRIIHDRDFFGFLSSSGESEKFSRARTKLGPVLHQGQVELHLQGRPRRTGCSHGALLEI